MGKVILLLKPIFWNKATLIILVLSFIAANLVMLVKDSEHFFDSLLAPGYPKRILRYWLIAITLVSLIKKITDHLDHFLPWPSEKDWFFSERLFMQVLLGVFMISLLAMNLANLCYWLGGIQLSETRFYEIEFVFIVFQIILFNCYYIISRLSIMLAWKNQSLISNTMDIIEGDVIVEEILENSEMEETTEAHDLEIAQILELVADARTVKVPVLAVGGVENETKVVEEAAQEAMNNIYTKSSATPIEMPVEETKEEPLVDVIGEEEIDTNADLMCKDGSETCYIAQADIAVIYIDQTNWVKNFNDDNKFSIDGALTKIYDRLNKYYFYQIRESIIVNREVIMGWERFKPAQFKLALKVKIIKNGIEQEIIVSQKYAIGFLKWYNKKQ